MRNIQCPTIQKRKEMKLDETRNLRGNNDGDVEAGFWIATLIQCRGGFRRGAAQQHREQDEALAIFWWSGLH